MKTALFRYYVEINANHIAFVAAVLFVIIAYLLVKDYLQRRKARRLP